MVQIAVTSTITTGVNMSPGTQWLESNPANRRRLARVSNTAAGRSSAYLVHTGEVTEEGTRTFGKLADQHADSALQAIRLGCNDLPSTWFVVRLV